MFKLVISDPDDGGKTTVVPLVRDEITIGRGEGNTIRLTERNISRRHARLRQSNGGFVLEDLGSYNGVRVNGTRIGAEAHLREGDQIVIGDYQLALQLEQGDTKTLKDAALPPSVREEQSDAATTMIAAPAVITTPARVVMLSSPARGTEYTLRQPRTRIGRAEDLDIWVNHRSISREHAEIIQTEAEIRLFDLDSANGVRVNGRDVKQAILRSGDTIEFGQVRFRFIGPGETYRIESDPAAQPEVPGLSPRAYRASIFAAAAIVSAAAVVAVVLATWDGDETVPVVGRLTSSKGTGTKLVAPPHASNAAFAEALRDCESALGHERYAEAVSFGTAAMRLKPDDIAARQCHEQAESALAEQQTYVLGKASFDRGDIEDAYFQFESLPDQSPYRKHREVLETMKRFAQSRLAQARAALSTDPEEAARLSGIVLNMSPPPRELEAEAKRIQGMARRKLKQAEASGGAAGTSSTAHSSSGAHSTSSTHAGGAETGGRNGTKIAPDRENGGPAESTAAADAAFDAARDCLARGDQRCAIRALEGNARNPRELALLIETYRSVGDTARALKYMSDFVKRFPNARQAAPYRQFLLRHGQ